MSADGGLTKRIKMPYSLTLASYKAMQQVTSQSGKGVYASGGVLFRGAVFGRDSLEVAEDLYVLRPKLVRSILLTLASLQGTKFDIQSEEEPGKIPHEHRTRIVDGRMLTDEEAHIYEQLVKHWGEHDNALTYYGSVDATPLFIRLVCKFVKLHGKSILKNIVIRKDGVAVTLQQVLDDALSWLDSSLAQSPYGLLAYQRTNPFGIENQVWKDSAEFYRHVDGTQANLNAPIASIEVQGIVYDALIYASDLLDRPALKARAAQLQDRTLSMLWMEDKGYFALGVDINPETQAHRLISTLTANPAELLDTCIFDSLADSERRKYISGIVRWIFSPEFLTPAGIRSRALSQQAIVHFWDYHGSYVSWPKETYDIARGLRYQNLPDLSRQLENRLTNITRRTQEFYEFYYVDARGRVLLEPSNGGDHDAEVQASNVPMEAQAWTISAIMALRYPSRIPTIRLQKAWQKHLEKEVLMSIPRMKLVRTRSALEKLYPPYTYKFVGLGTWIDDR